MSKVIVNRSEEFEWLYIIESEDTNRRLVDIPESQVQRDIPF